MTPPLPTALVVEDDDDVAHLLASHLSRLGWDVTLATSGEQAWEAARRRPPDVAVVDVLLPGMDGHQLVALLRADATTAGCRVVVTSVLDRDQQDGAGVDAVLPKPFSRSDVRRVMGALRQAGSPS